MHEKSHYCHINIDVDFISEKMSDNYANFCILVNFFKIFFRCNFSINNK